MLCSIKSSEFTFIDDLREAAEPIIVHYGLQYIMFALLVIGNIADSYPNIKKLMMILNFFAILLLTLQAIYFTLILTFQDDDEIDYDVFMLTVGELGKFIFPGIIVILFKQAFNWFQSYLITKICYLYVCSSILAFMTPWRKISEGMYIKPSIMWSATAILLSISILDYFFFAIIPL